MGIFKKMMSMMWGILRKWYAALLLKVRWTSRKTYLNNFFSTKSSFEISKNMCLFSRMLIVNIKVRKNTSALL